MSKNGNITIKDIAAQCGVGLGTVSRAINGKPGVKDEVRRKILNFVNEIGWRNSSLLGDLNREEKSKLIVFVSSLHPLFDRLTVNDIFANLLERCAAEGYETLIMLEGRKDALKRCLQIKPYAVIQFGSYENFCEDEKVLLKAGIRVISIAECLNYAGVILHPDHYHAGRKMAKTLLKAGHSKIGVVCGMGENKHLSSLEQLPSLRLKRFIGGVLDAHPAFNLSEELVSDNFGNPDGLMSVMKSSGITAWICDEIRSCALFFSCAYKLGLRVPEALSVISLAPADGNIIFPVDVARLSEDGQRAEKVMELLKSEEFPERGEFVFKGILCKGESIANIK